MNWRLGIEGRQTEIRFWAENGGQLMDKLLEGLNALMAHPHAWSIDSWCLLQVRTRQNAEMATIARLQLFKEMAAPTLGVIKTMDLDTEGGLSAWCHQKAERAKTMFHLGRQLSESVEDLKTRPPAGDGRPDSAGCGGAGCLDPTCAYCCADFIDEEDYTAAYGGSQEEDAGGMEIVEAKGMMLLPPRPGLCQECATDHDARLPHNVESLYYQTKFNMEHGRAATWADAAAHCTQDMRKQWAKAAVNVYAEHGQDVPEDLKALADVLEKEEEAGKGRDKPASAQ